MALTETVSDLNDIMGLIPHVCPSCGANLSIHISDNGVEELFCENVDCPTRNVDLVAQVCKRFNIMHISNKLIAKFNINTIDKLIDFKATPGSKLEETLENELNEKIFKASKMDVFCGLSCLIPGMARKEFERLVQKFGFEACLTFDFSNTRSEMVKDNLYFENCDKVREFYNKIINHPNYKGTQEDNAMNDPKTAKNINSKTICFTGKLEFMTRNDAQGVARKAGYRILEAVTKDLDVLVVADAALEKAPSSKLVKARKLGVTIMGETEFMETALPKA